MSALGRLVASVILDHAEFVGGTEKAKQAAASMATDIDRGFKDLERNVKGTIGGIAGALAAGFGIAAMKDAFDSFVRTAAALNDLALKAGTTVQWMSSVSPVAKLAGTSMDDIATAAEKMSKAIVTGTPGATQALAFLGVSTTDASGKMKNSGQIMEEVASRLNEYQDGVAKTAIAQELFGKSGANMLPFLKELAEYGERDAKLTQQQAALAKEYEQDLIRLQIAKDNLFKVISKELLPVADAFVKVLLEWQKQTGGARDQVQALANDGAIRDFAMGGVRAFALLLDAGDGVRRLFDLLGEEVGYFAARATNTLTAAAEAIIKMQTGQITAAWQIIRDASTRDAGIVAANGERVRAIFEKPLAGDSFLATFDTKLASVDRALNTTTESTKKSADGFKVHTGAEKAADDATKELIKSDLELIRALDQLLNIGKDFEIQMREQVEQRAFEVTLIGKSKDEIEKLTAARKIDLELRQAAAKISQEDDSDSSAAQAAALDRLLKIADAGKQQIAILNDQGAAARAAMKALQEETRAWSEAGDAVGRFFGDFVVNGKSAIARVRDDLKQFVQDLIALTAKRWFLSLVAGVTGSGAVADAAAQGGSSALVNAGASALGSYIGGAGTAIGGVYGASEGFAMGWGSGVAGAGAGFAETAGATLSGVYEGITTVLADIPVYGWIALAVLAIAAYFGGKGGGPKVGGYSGSSFDADGNLTGSAAAPGTDNGRFFTPSQMDSQLKTVTDQFGKAYTDTLKFLGGTAKGFSFLLGVDNDPNGTAQSRVSAGLLDSSGKYLYKNVDQNMDDKQVPAAIALEMSRAVLVALQHSDLPSYLSKVFDGIDASKATKEDIDNAMAQAVALKGIFDIASRNPLDDVAKGMEDSQHTLANAFKQNETAIRGVMDAYDGSLKSTQALQQATIGYYNAQLQLLASISQAKAAIDDMFGNTFRNITLATLDNQGKYNFYKNEAAELEAKALASDDPETIRALAEKINADIANAFNLLSPEEQKAHAGDFLKQGKEAQDAIDARLEKIQKDAADKTQDTLNKIKDLIGAGADKMEKAGDKMQTAADTQLQAARTPRQLIVVTQHDGQQVVPIGSGG